MSSSGTESDSSASSDVDFDDYGEFGYQLEPEYMEEELRQMEEAASAQRQNDTNWCSCSRCISLPLPSECLCCHEFSLFDGQLEPSDCITDNVSTLLCLKQAILVF